MGIFPGIGFTNFYLGMNEHVHAAIEMLKLRKYYEEYVYPGRKHYLPYGNKKYATYFDEEILGKTDAFLEKFGLYLG